MPVSVTVPKDLQAISAGQLISEDADSDPNTATWQWRTDRPTPTYTVGLAIGPFRIERETVDGIPYVYAVSKLLSADEQNVAMDTLKTTPMRVRQLAAMYGKYPMDAGGGLVSAMSTSFGALEIAGRFDLRHGEAVGIGLVYAAELARHLGRIDAHRVAEHRRVVAGYDLPLTLPGGITDDELLELLARDKKALDGLTFVLDGPAGVEVVAGVAPSDVVTSLEAVR